MNSLRPSGNLPETDNEVLVCIVHAARMRFAGTWHVVPEPLAEYISPVGLPVSFDYLVHVHGSNHLIFPDDLDVYKTFVANARTGVQGCEVRIMTDDGRVKRLFMTGSLAEGDKGPYSGNEFMPDRYAREGDVDWELMTYTLQHQKALMESVIQSDIVALSVLKPIYGAAGAEDFQWVIANKLLKAIAQGKDVIGHRYTEVFPAAAKDGSLDLLRKVLATGEREAREVYYANDHVKGWLRQVCARSQGYVIVSAEDITLEKKKQEQIAQMNEQLAQRSRKQYQELFGSIDQGFALVQLLYDSEGTAVDLVYLQVNSEFEKMAGLTDVVGKTLVSLETVHPGAWVNAYQQVVATQAPLQIIMPGDKQETKFYEVYAFPAGEPAACTVAVLLSDVTARQATTRQLQALNEQLQQMDRAKTRFFSNVSHEFRTPLTLIQAPLQDVLRDDSGLPAAHRRALAMVERSVLRLQKLVNNLLDFSRVEAGRLEAIFQPTRLAELTAEIAANFQPLLERAGLKLVVKADKLLESVYVNRDMWEKIVLNLLSNAFKFTHQGKIEVRLHEKKFAVQLMVRDTGIGIAPQDLPHIFERFYRQEHAKARTYEGTGIGLALVREQVEMHGGTIKVKSEEGKGTTFTVTLRKGKAHLPVRQIFETSSHLVNSYATGAFLQEATGWLPDTPADPGPEAKKKPLILVVEDNADMRAYLINALSPQYRIMPANHGRTALDLMDKGHRPALIVSDVMMPELDGYGLVSALRNDATRAHIPIILLSAHSNEEAVIQAMHLGATDYLEKPFSSRKLRALVEARLRLQVADDRR